MAIYAQGPTGERIPVYLSGIQMTGGGGGTSYKAGDGIVIDGNVISVEVPVVPLTRAEYDALSDEDKQKNVLYVLTDEVDEGGGGADGADGVSPTVSVAEITGGHRVTITDVNGTKSFDVLDGKDGKDGDDGADGDNGVTMAEVNTAIQTAIQDSRAVTSETITTITSVTQAEYDALTTKDANTLYVIKEE